MLPTINNQLLHVLVLCENADRENIDASQFFLAPCNTWSRVVLKPVPADGSHDVDEDEDVKTESAASVQKLRKVRLHSARTCLCLRIDI
eukprot:5317314-Pleurochrysis_carterae.AAC.1